MTNDLLEANEKLFKLNQKLIEDKRKLRNALGSFEKGYGCFCGCPHSRGATIHSETCVQAKKAMEETK